MSDEAPSRTILCAGAGHFATANVTLTKGIYTGSGEQAADALVGERHAMFRAP